MSDAPSADARAGAPDSSLAAPVGSALPYRAAIDGLRAIAVLAVVAGHLDDGLVPSGFLGVDVFFVISGFLITSLIVREADGGGFDARRFYQRRIARLIPAFCAMAVVTMAAAWQVYTSQDLSSAAAGLAASACFLMNVKLLGQGGYFEEAADGRPFQHCWSLSVEEQFYLVYPWLLVWLTRRAPSRRAGAAMALGGASLAAWLWLWSGSQGEAFLLLPTRAWELLAGAWLALRPRAHAADARASWAPLAGLGVVLSAMLLPSDLVLRHGWLFVLPVAGTVAVVDARSSPVERWLSWSPLTVVGRLSYSLYLWHWPVFALVEYGGCTMPTLSRRVLEIALTALATIVCHGLVERPLRRWLVEPARCGLAYLLLGGSVIGLVSFGLWAHDWAYPNVTLRDVQRGGRVLNRGGTAGTLVLMGDSQACTWVRPLERIARERDLRLIVLCAAGVDPLPATSGRGDARFEASLSVVRDVAAGPDAGRDHPTVVVLACNWVGRVRREPQRLTRALEALRAATGPLGRIVLVTQPPLLGPEANRDGLRAGSRPPFVEPSAHRERRRAVQRQMVEGRGARVSIVDIEATLVRSDGSVACFDEEMRPLYHDSKHLNDRGARRVEPLLRAAVEAALR